MIQATLSRLKKWMVRTADLHHSTMSMSAAESVGRIASVVVPLITLHCAAAIALLFKLQESLPEATRSWLHHVMGVHAGLVLALLTIGAVTRLTLSDKLPNKLRVMAILQFALPIAYLSACVILSTVGIRVGQENGESVYSIALVVISALMVIPPMRFAYLALTSFVILLMAIIPEVHAVGGDLMIRYINLGFYNGLAILINIVCYHTFALREKYRMDLHRATTQLDIQQKELTLLADRDELTGLFNQRKFLFLARMEIARAGRFRTTTSQLIIDIDKFSSLTAAHGKMGGDVILKHVAAIITNTTRTTDIVSRLSRDRFAVLLPGTALAGAVVAAEKIRTAIHEYTFTLLSDPFQVTVSVGVGSHPAVNLVTLEQLQEASDKSLLIAKKSGESCIKFLTVE